MIKNSRNIFVRIGKFYLNGFRTMGPWGRQVWLIILIKLFIMFVILKIFFFPDFLNTKFETDEQRSDYILEILTEPKK